MLLERCRPGTPLAAAGADLALDVLTELLPRLWIPVPDGPFDTLAEAWAMDGDGRPFPGSLELVEWLTP